VRVTIAAEDTKSTKEWPKVKGRAQIWGGVLSEPLPDLFQDTQAEPMRPSEWGKKIHAQLEPQLWSLEQGPLKVLRREGRWIYLSKGRASGYKIGMHLLGPGGAKLHVIQALGAPPTKGPREAESAVALLREEAKETPLKAGDSVWLDPAQYPKRDPSQNPSQNSSGSGNPPQGSGNPPTNLPPGLETQPL
jgi:hypothetical protein